MSFEGYITSLCKKVNQKLQAQAKIINYIDLPKRQLSMKVFITMIMTYDYFNESLYHYD